MRIRILIGAILTIPLLFPMLHIPYSLSPLVQFCLATIVQFGVGYSFYLGAYRSIARGKADMDVLVALGTSAAYGLSVWATFAPHPHLYFETSSVLITLILVGRFLEKRSKESARSGMHALLSLQSASARVLRGEWGEVPVEEVAIGERIMVRAGESVPVDGTVASGDSHIDESMLTGESRAVRKVEGDKIYAGTLNGNGVIEMIASSIGSETALGRIIHLVEAAAATRPPVQKLVNRITAIFVPAVLISSLLTFLLWWLVGNTLSGGILNGVATLVIACPCALGLATPMVILVATSRGAKEGILLKDTEGLQKGAALSTLLLDKTGTVTEGKLRVVHVEGDLVQAASLAANSDHPLSSAITAHAKGNTLLPCTEYRAVPGKGVMGKIAGSEVFLGSLSFLREQGISIEAPEDHRVIVAFGSKEKSGYIALEDVVKADAKEAIAALQSMGVEVALVSGDRKGVVDSVARALAIEKRFAEVLPEEKAGCVRALQEGGKCVGMVGDGINDAPALAQADVGFAMGSGTDIAMENAGIGLMRPELMIAPRALRLCRRAMRKMKGNLLFAFLFNGIGIPIAAAGYLNPMIAGTAMALSSICVVLNAISLRNH